MANIAELLLRPENERLLRAHIRSIVRMSTESPFDDIMDGCSKILVRVSRVHLSYLSSALLFAYFLHTGV